MPLLFCILVPKTICRSEGQHHCKRWKLFAQRKPWVTLLLYPDGTSRNNNKKQPGQVLTPSLAMDTVVGNSVTMCNSNLFGFACGSRQHERLTVTGAARGRVSFSDIPCVLVVFKIRLLAKLYIAISPAFVSMYFVTLHVRFLIVCGQRTFSAQAPDGVFQPNEEQGELAET